MPCSFLVNYNLTINVNINMTTVVYFVNAVSVTTFQCNVFPEKCSSVMSVSTKVSKRAVMLCLCVCCSYLYEPLYSCQRYNKVVSGFTLLYVCCVDVENEAACL